MTGERPPLSFEAPPSLLSYDDGAARLLLRPSRVEEATPIADAIQESLPELRAFSPWAHVPQTPDAQRTRLQAIERGRGTSRDLFFHLYEHHGGPFLGCLGLHGGRSLNPRCYELGYWVRSSHAGRGLTTLAARCAVVLGFDYFGLDRIQCVFNEHNLASERVTRKVGFQEEARLRRFEVAPTDEMRAHGCLMGPLTVVTALFPDDRADLAWYAGVAAALTVRDCAGRVVQPVHT